MGEVHTSGLTRCQEAAVSQGRDLEVHCVCVCACARRVWVMPAVSLRPANREGAALMCLGGWHFQRQALKKKINFHRSRFAPIVC